MPRDEEPGGPATVAVEPAEKDPAFHFTWRGIDFEWNQGQKAFTPVRHGAPRCTVTARGREWSTGIYILGTTLYGTGPTPEEALEAALDNVAAFAKTELERFAGVVVVVKIGPVDG